MTLIVSLPQGWDQGRSNVTGRKPYSRNLLIFLFPFFLWLSISYDYLLPLKGRKIGCIQASSKPSHTKHSREVGRISDSPTISSWKDHSRRKGIIAVFQRVSRLGLGFRSNPTLLSSLFLLKSSPAIFVVSFFLFHFFLFFLFCIRRS